MTFRFLSACMLLMWGGLDALTSSLIIPCHSPHFRLLEGLLEHYEHQHRLPDEVVVALSGCADIDTNELQALQTRGFAFPVRFILNDGPVSRGANRNLAAGQATGDILVCQDADDFAHPDRIALCMRVFESQPEVNFLLHGCALSPDSAVVRNAYSLRIPLEEFLSLSFNEANLPCYAYPKQKLPKNHHCFCNGVPILKRSIWASGAHWIESLQRTEDVRYVRALVNRFGGGIFMDLPLYFYRRELSAGYSGRSVWTPEMRS